MSLALYVLVGLPPRAADASNEAALKYFLLGAFATAFLLYGIALLYGATGTTNLARIASAADSPPGAAPDCCSSGVALLLVGLRLQGGGGAVPHVDAGRLRGRADAGDGVHGRRGRRRPAFAALLRVFLHRARRRSQPIGTPSSPWIAVLTMTVGNVTALLQHERQAHARVLEHRARRATCWSAVVAGGAARRRRPCSSTWSSTVMNLGAFAVLILLGAKGERGRELETRRARLPPARCSASRMIALHALAGGHPADGGLHRASSTSSARRSSRARAARGDRRAEQRDLGLLLPARHGAHVHAGAAGDAAADPRPGHARGGAPRDGRRDALAGIFPGPLLDAAREGIKALFS